jgi:predicted nucleic acid-binding protein
MTNNSANHVVDSGILIRSLRGDRRADDLVDTLAESPRLAVSSITAFEVLRGATSTRQESSVNRLVDRFAVLPVTLTTARTAAEIIKTNRGIFGSREIHSDALIAATAVASSMRFVTLNTRQFSQVRYPGLELVLVDQDAEDWRAFV